MASIASCGDKNIAIHRSTMLKSWCQSDFTARLMVTPDYHTPLCCNIKTQKHCKTLYMNLKKGLVFVTEQNCHRTIVAISKYWKCTAMKLLSQTTSANRTQTFTHFDFISLFSEIFVCIANCDVAETQNKSCKMTLLPIAGERITVMLGDFTALQIFSAGLLRCQSCADNEGIWGKQWKNEGEKGKIIDKKTVADV